MMMTDLYSIAEQSAVPLEDKASISNTQNTMASNSEYIREHMVQFIVDTRYALRTSGIEQYSNSFSTSLNHVRSKMIFGQ